jgi:peroxiredoxin
MRLALCLALATSLVAAGPEVPRPAGNFAIQTGPDKYIWLSDYPGKTIVLVFILTNCTYCEFTTGLLNGIQRDFAGRGVQVLETAIDSMASLHLADFQKKFQPAFPLGYDELNYATKFLSVPENESLFAPVLVFIDRTGIIRAQFGGNNPALDKAIQDATLRAALDKTLREGQPPKQ